MSRSKRAAVLVPADRLPVVMGDVARVPLTRGQFALIDARDAKRVGTRCWYAQWDPYAGRYYAVRNGSKVRALGEPRTVMMHRFITRAPAGTEVDHANHESLDNRRANLRVTTHALNQRNRSSTTAANTSGYLGVTLHRGSAERGSPRPWIAGVRIDGRTVHVGAYADPVEAALARDAWIREHHPSEFWTFNFPRPGERGIDPMREIA